jgi:hypothetical protein
LTLYLLLYAGLLVAYVTVVFHMARNAAHLINAVGVDTKAQAGAGPSAVQTALA